MASNLSDYSFGKELGRGSFGIVYTATHVRTGGEVAIKVELSDEKPCFLRREHEVLQRLTGGVGIPIVRKFGQQDKFSYMIMDCLGSNLDATVQYCGGKFPLKQVLTLAKQLICQISFIHSKSIIHRDIKPDNLTLGPRNLQIYLIDFGLAKQYRDDKTGTHIVHQEGVGLRGTPEFASVQAQLGNTQSRRDDLESIMYVLIKFGLGRLPWSHLSRSTQPADTASILKMKKMLPQQIRHGAFPLPLEFATALDYVRSLRFDGDPDYAHIHTLMANIWERERFTNDNVTDWGFQKRLNNGVRSALKTSRPSNTAVSRGV